MGEKFSLNVLAKPHQCVDDSYSIYTFTLTTDLDAAYPAVQMFSPYLYDELLK